MNFERRVTANGQAACKATSAIPALLAAGNLSETELMKLDAVLHRKQVELDLLVVDLLAPDVDEPALLALTTRISGIWGTLRRLLDEQRETLRDAA